MIRSNQIGSDQKYQTINAASRVMNSIFYKFIQIGLYDAIKIWILQDS